MIPVYVMNDFFAWLWFLSEDGGRTQLSDGRLIDVIVEDQISFREPNGTTDRAVFRGKITGDARQSFAIGKVVDSASVEIKVEDDRSYKFRFGKGGISSFKVRVPFAGTAEDISSSVHENLLLLSEGEGVLHRLFLDYLEARVSTPEKLVAQFLTLSKQLEADGSTADAE